MKVGTLGTAAEASSGLVSSAWTLPARRAAERAATALIFMMKAVTR